MFILPSIKGRLYPRGSHFAYIYRCELIFILYATGIPEPSDEECQEGSHLYVDAFITTF